MDTFKEEIYGKVLWECYRSKVYIVMLSLLYVAVAAGGILFALKERGIPSYFLAAFLIFISLWRINRVHHPVALVCERKLLVAVPWSFFTFDYYITFRALYMPVDYKEVAGISGRWDRLYIGAHEVGGMVALPVQLAYVSVGDKVDFQSWIESKQCEN